MENHIVHEDQDHLSSSEVVPASLQLLITHSKETKQLGNKKIIIPADQSPSRSRSSNNCSTEQIMRIAAKRFMDSSIKTVDVVSMLDNPFNFSPPDENTEKMELAELLMAAAEKVNHQLYDRARILINRCNKLSSSTGNAVERVVYYFSQALGERIERKTEKAKSQRPKKQKLFNIAEAITTPNPNLLSLCKEVPFPQIAHCAGTQAVTENVTRAKKIHIIDLGIKMGLQWASLMQALASETICPLELLKITAVGTTMKQQIESTGKRLTSFAESIGLPFSFNIVMVSDMLELDENLFKLVASETVIVYSSYLLKTLIPFPETLDHTIKVIRNVNPIIVMVLEPELSTTSTSFAKLFVELIFYFSAYFDCLEKCLGDNPNRENIESLIFGKAIRRILATDGDDRDFFHVKLEVWRAFFARFGMVETQISRLSLYHGEQMAKKFDSGNECTLEMDGKSLLIGWKGTPLISFSAWKFKN